MIDGQSATPGGSRQHNSTQERFHSRLGMTYGEWLRMRDRQSVKRLRADYSQGSEETAKALTEMAGINYNDSQPDQKVEEAMAILRKRNPLGGPWISLARDYRRMRQAEASFNI